MISKPGPPRGGKRWLRSHPSRRRWRSRGLCGACLDRVPAVGRPNLDLYPRHMQTRRPLRKPERHRLIESVVTRKRVGTQFELIDALADAGCVVTQATVSRDIRELGLEKTHDPLGRARYVLPHLARRHDPREALQNVLGQFGRRVTAAGNIVV